MLLIGKVQIYAACFYVLPIIINHLLLTDSIINLPACTLTINSLLFYAFIQKILHSVYFSMLIHKKIVIPFRKGHLLLLKSTLTESFLLLSIKYK